MCVCLSLSLSAHVFACMAVQVGHNRGGNHPPELNEVLPPGLAGKLSIWES